MMIKANKNINWKKILINLMAEQIIMKLEIVIGSLFKICVQANNVK